MKITTSFVAPSDKALKEQIRQTGAGFDGKVFFILDDEEHLFFVYETFRGLRSNTPLAEWVFDRGSRAVRPGDAITLTF